MVILEYKSIKYKPYKYYIIFSMFAFLIFILSLVISIMISFTSRYYIIVSIISIFSLAISYLYYDIYSIKIEIFQDKIKIEKGKKNILIYKFCNYNYLAIKKCELRCGYYIILTKCCDDVKISRLTELINPAHKEKSEEVLIFANKKYMFLIAEFFDRNMLKYLVK